MTNYQRMAKQAGNIIAEQAGMAAFKDEMARVGIAETPTSIKPQGRTTISLFAVSKHIHAQCHHNTTGATIF